MIKEEVVEEDDSPNSSSSSNCPPSPTPTDTAIREFICTFPNCGKRFKRNFALRQHALVHQEVKPYACDVEGCSASYTRQHHLVRHVQNSHSNPAAEFKCNRTGCVASFTTQYSLTQHVKRKHGRDIADKYLCADCGDVFNHVWQLQEHSVSHGRSNPFKCDYCNEGFQVYTAYKTHLRENHEVRLTYKNEKIVIRSVPYICDVCDMKFKKFRQFIQHMRLEHPLLCTHCSKTFANKSRLREHSCPHSEVRETFKCPEEGCTKSYLHERNLQTHMKLAHKGVRFTCPICDQKLKTKQKLQQHIRVIHEKPSSKQEQRKLKPLRKVPTIKEMIIEGLRESCNTKSLYELPKVGPKAEPVF